MSSATREEINAAIDAVKDYLIGRGWQNKGGADYTGNCIICQGGEHQDAGTGYYNADAGAYKCHRVKCDANTNSVLATELCERFGIAYGAGGGAGIRRAPGRPKGRTASGREYTAAELEKAAAVCKAALDAAAPATLAHPYLVAKGIDKMPGADEMVKGLYIDAGGNLLVPYKTRHGGGVPTITYIEVIPATPGAKKYSIEGSRGHCLRKVRGGASAVLGAIYIAEGMATGCAVAAALGDDYAAVFACRGSDGLLPAAERCRAHLGSNTNRVIVICTDAGRKSESKALAAAGMCGALLAYTGNEKDGYDFNDLYLEKGAAHTRGRLVNGALVAPLAADLASADIAPDDARQVFISGIYAQDSAKRWTAERIQEYIAEWNGKQAAVGRPVSVGEMMGRIVAPRYAGRMQCSKGRRGEYYAYDAGRWQSMEEVDVKTVIAQFPIVVSDKKGGQRLAPAPAHAIAGGLEHYRARAGFDTTKLDDHEHSGHLLHCRERTWDLHTGAARAHISDDYITRTLAHEPANTATPVYDRFMADFTDGDDGLRRELERALGATLVGSTNHGHVYILHGDTQKGKSTLIDLIQHILGDTTKAGYAANVGTNLLLPQNRYINADEMLANIRGARGIVCSDPPKSGALRSDLLKQLTGGDIISGRQLYKNREQFPCIGQLWIATNFEPTIKDVHPALMRRIRLVPCDMQIDKIDLDFKEKLKAEAPGILYRWIGEAVKWLQPYEAGGWYYLSNTVNARTSKYGRNQDTLGQAVEMLFTEGEYDSNVVPKSEVAPAVFEYLAATTGQDLHAVKRAHKVGDIVDAMHRARYVAGHYSRQDRRQVWHRCAYTEEGEKYRRASAGGLVG